MNKYAKTEPTAFGGAHTIQEWIDRARIEKQYTWANRLVQILVYVKLLNGRVVSLEKTVAELSAKLPAEVTK